jgi:hypothetical protein
MTPELSRRIAFILSSKFLNDKGIKFKNAFIDRVIKVENFKNLKAEDKALILKVEKEQRK